MAVIGYARVSSEDQDLTVQLDQLKAAGCTKVFSEKKSGVTLKERSELENCLRYVREGDTLVFTRIDRLARSVMDFNKTVTELQARGVELRCLLQPFDTTSASGRLMVQILAAFAEFENSVRRERQAEGIAKAKLDGSYVRRTKNMQYSPNQWKQVADAIRAGLSTDAAGEVAGIPGRTVRERYPRDRIESIRLAHQMRQAGNLKRKLINTRAESPPTLPPSAAEAVAPQATAPEAERKGGIFGRLLGGR